MRFICAIWPRLMTFQSAPAIAGGRCCRAPPSARTAPGFNPRPPLLAGDACRALVPRHGTSVSIRARHCWRAMPVRADRPLARSGVSIRARHCWRAMRPGQRRPRARREVSIRARHCWRAMRDWGAHRRGRPWFQSAPAIAGGRCDWGKVRPTHSRRFNPRPPLLAGDAVAHLRAAVGQAVSIRARHCWRAMHAPGLVFPEVVMFQSAPAIAGGRCVAGAGAIFTVRGFNPRPPLLAGDAPPLCGRQLCPAVSIRARHCWRAMPAQGRVPRLRPKFQSAPAIAGGRCRRK